MSKKTPPFLRGIYLAKKIIDLHLFYQRGRATPAIEVKKMKLRQIKKEIEELNEIIQA